MPPKGMSNSKAIFAHPLQTQADDAKYRTKYQQLKGKLQEVEQDNAKLALRVLRSKKSIQRLRIERAILYDRLQNSSTPTDPYKLRSSTHLSKLSTATTSTTVDPTNEATSAIPEENENENQASISTSTTVPTVAPQQDLFLQPMSQAKLAALVQPPPFSEHDPTPPTGVKDWGERPYAGVVGEGTSSGAQPVEVVAHETTGKVEDGNEGEQAMQE